LDELGRERDKLGRIRFKTETLQGQSSQSEYRYDLAGRLTTEIKNGLSTTFGYDSNGNRTHLNGQIIAHYDSQDRLLDYAGITYGYSANGELQDSIFVLFLGDILIRVDMESTPTPQVRHVSP